jgi:hypothetical protein
MAAVHDAAGRRRNFGERARSAQGSGLKTGGARVLLTFKRGSGSASRRRRGNSGEERRRRRGLGFRRGAEQARAAAMARVGNPRGAVRL